MRKIPITYVDEQSIEEVMIKTLVKHQTNDAVLNVIKLNDEYDLVRFIDENKNPYSVLIRRPKEVARCEYTKEAEAKMLNKYLGRKDKQNGST